MSIYTQDQIQPLIDKAVSLLAKLYFARQASEQGDDDMVEDALRDVFCDRDEMSTTAFLLMSTECPDCKGASVPMGPGPDPEPCDRCDSTGYVNKTEAKEFQQ